MGRRPPFFVINRVVVYLDKTNKLASSFFALCFSVFFGNEVCGQISITLTGSWSETINAADLTAGPGSDLQDSYESAADAASLSISGTGGVGDTWRIDVKKVDANWHGNFVLSVRRTSAGTGGSVSGGDAYQQVTDTDNSFFSGSEDVSGINVQLKLSGVSIQVPPDTYTTTVYYTVVDT